MGLIAAVLTTPAYAASGLAVYQPESVFTAYLESDVRIIEQNPVVLRPGQYLKSGDVYLVDATAAQGSNVVYLELLVDWIEPLNLTAAKDTIRIDTMLGTVEAELPDAVGQFQPVQVGQTFPTGTRLRVGPGGCAGIDIGGRHAVCLIPGTDAAITRSDVGGTDTIKVNLVSGAVFSHVNLSKKDTDFSVRTPLAVAGARGTDFVTVALPDKTDVWIQEGEVEVKQIDGTPVGTVSSTEGGAPKILRFPPVADEVERVRANSATLTAAATLIPQLNQRLPAIRAKQAQGTPLDAEEAKILGSAKRMHILIKVVSPVSKTS